MIYLEAKKVNNILNKNNYFLRRPKHQDAALWTPYQNIKSSIKKWRRDVFPANIKNIRDFCTELNNEAIKPLFETETVKLQSKLITDADNNVHLVFYDLDFIRKHFQQVKELFIDATFDTVTKLDDAYQLFSILGIIVECVSITDQTITRSDKGCIYQFIYSTYHELLTGCTFLLESYESKDFFCL